MLRVRRFAILALPLIVAGPGLAPEVSRTPARSEADIIRAARLAQNRAIARLDFDSVASFWTPDITVMSGLGLAFQGRDFYRRAFAADSSVTYERTPTTITVSRHWPLAYEQGTWEGHPSGATRGLLIGGPYSAMWMKVNGRWLIKSELFVAMTCGPPACGWPATRPPS